MGGRLCGSLGAAFERRVTVMAGGPKQRTGPHVANSASAPDGFVHVPIDVMQPFNSYWRAVGNHLPHSINRQRAARKAMLRGLR